MSPVEYPPLTSVEIEDVANRAQMGRLRQHSPIIDGELLITAYQGFVTVKRYIGVDAAEI